MPTKKVQKQPVKNTFKAIWLFIKEIVNWLKHLLILLERTLKIIAILLIVLSASVLFLITSLYLFTSTFGLKESPAFQELRDEIAEDFAASVEDDLEEVEIEIETGDQEE